VVSGSKIFKGVMTLGLNCLGLSVSISVLSAFVPIPTAPQIVGMLSDGFNGRKLKSPGKK
jgi:hypothetical protein